jgi:transposase
MSTEHKSIANIKNNSKNKNNIKTEINPNHKNDLILISLIEKNINNNPKLHKSFNHPNRKYKTNELLKYVLEILRTGIPFRNIKANMHWCTIYNFFQKLINSGVIYDTYQKNISQYLNKLDKIPNYNKTDTTFICNKLGENFVSFNPQVKKHKTSKISIITDDYDIPISISVNTGSTHDSTILNSQLDELHKAHPILFNNNKILLADAAYDSQKLRDTTAKLNFGKVLTYKNIRNGKKSTLEESYSMTDNLILKKRIGIEHNFSNYKQYRRCQLRYDRIEKNFTGFVYLASLAILIKKVGRYLIN